MENKPTFEIKLSPVWLKAAVLGGLWASIEIIIGSFFHNLRLPFAGTILAANATILMIAFYQMWPEKGLIWRAGLIAALMKSVSPSAIILGPMIGIMSEALVMELFLRFFGNNLLSLSVAGALAVSSAFIHKIVSLLILYGFKLVTIYVNIFHFATKQVRIENADPWLLVLIIVTVYLLFGIASAFIGLRIGKRYKNMVLEKRGFVGQQHETNNLLSINPKQKFSIVLFTLHILIIPTGLVLLNLFPLEYSISFVLIYSALCIFWYKKGLRRLKKSTFWFQIFIPILLASLFWNSFLPENSFFDMEGLLIGIEMCFRALFVVIAFSSLSIELRNPLISNYLFNKGSDTIYAVLGLAFTALPVMIEAMPNPKRFLRHPVESFSAMMMHAREWLEVFELTGQEKT